MITIKSESHFSIPNRKTPECVTISLNHPLRGNPATSLRDPVFGIADHVRAHHADSVGPWSSRSTERVKIHRLSADGLLSSYSRFVDLHD